MTAKVLLVGCARLPTGDGDEHRVPGALADLDIAAEWAVWSDPSVDWAAHDLVIPRATWDYSERRAEFLRWCEAVPTLRNPAAVARWNTDKAYLLDLADAGVPVVPSTLVRPDEAVELPEGEFVVKPSVGAGSRGVQRFSAEDADRAREHLAALHRAGRSALVQPYQPSVAEHGETALVFFGGVFSHAFGKASMLGNPLDGAGLYVAEKLAEADPPAGFRCLAERALDAAAEILSLPRKEFLYARVDVLHGRHGEPVVLELELTEPSLGFAYARGAEYRFASAVRAALG